MIINLIKIENVLIVATGSVVKKNVKPYGIVDGVPANNIKMRFAENEIEFLQELKWWEKDRKWFLHYSKYFISIGKLTSKLKY